ncbi:MAG: low-affinity phosphate transporter, partial [Watsoniomyces obsoletus]
ALSLRTAADPATVPSALPVAALTCAGPSQVAIDKAGLVTALKCRDAANKLDYVRYAATRGRNHFIVEGLAGYDPALRLALASLLLDRAQSGVVQVATTEVSDPAAFARTQAGSLDAAGARAETLLGHAQDPSQSRRQGDHEEKPATTELRTPVGKFRLPAWMLSSTFLILLIILAIFLVLLFAPIMESPEQQNCLAMLIFVSLLWATEAIPLFVTSFLVPFLVVILRI